MLSGFFFLYIQHPVYLKIAVFDGSGGGNGGGKAKQLYTKPNQGNRWTTVQIAVGGAIDKITCYCHRLLRHLLPYHSGLQWPYEGSRGSSHPGRLHFQ